MSKVATSTIWNLKYLVIGVTLGTGGQLSGMSIGKKCLCFLIMYCNKYKYIIPISSQ